MIGVEPRAGNDLLAFVQKETGTTNVKTPDNRPLASREHGKNSSISHSSLDNIGFCNRSSLYSRSLIY